MRRSLLNKQILSKPLRQALVLITLLLPNAAWGQEQAQDFYVQIGGTKVSANNNEITGEGISFGENGFISYSHDESTGTGTLTLKNATINYTGNSQALITSNTVDKLIIELRGNNIIQTTQDVNAISGNITLKNILTVIEFTSTTQDGSLLLENKATNASTAVIGSVTINDDSYKNGLEPRIIYFTAQSSLTFATKAVIAIPYGISIAGVEVTSANNTNILDDANKTVSFTPANATTSPATPATLTLNGASISGGGIYTTLENLEIDLVNTNTIETGQGTTDQGTRTRNGIMSTKNGTLTFVAASNASLEITSTAAAIKGFQTINGNLETHVPYTIKSKNDNSPNQDLYRTCEIEGDSVAITWMKISDLETYPLWIGDNQVNADNKDHILGSGNTTITFSPASSPATLTLNNANFGPSLKGIVWNGSGDLKIQYSGNNTINTWSGSELNAGDDGYCILGKSSSRLNLSASNAASTLTLRPSNGGSNSRAAISGFTDVQIDKTNGWGMYYTDDYSDADPENPTAGEEVVLLKDYLGIAVAGVPVTSSNASEITGDGISGTISFDPEEKILTLDNATIDYSETAGNPIVSSIDNLKVKLIGVNEIKIFSAVYFGFKYTDDATSGALTFVDPTSFSEIGQLSVSSEEISSISFDNFSSGYTITGFTDFADGGSNEYYNPDNSGWVKYQTTSYVKVRYIEVYDLWVEGSRISSINLNPWGSGYTGYNPETHSIAFDNNSSILRINSNLPELIIELSGDNSLTVTDTDTSEPAISFTSSDKTPTGKLKFTVGGNSATVNSMVIDCEKGAIVGFSEVIVDDPLKISVNSTTKVVISDEEFYNLWVGGVQVSSGNASDIFNTTETKNYATVSFDKTTNTLTLKEANIQVNGKNGIESGLATLTVIISGTNSIDCQGTETVAFKGVGTDNAIAFKLDTSDPGELYIQCSNNPIIDGLEVEYEDGIGLIALESDYYSIGELQKPEINSSASDEGISVALILPSGDSYIGSTMYYSITYNDEEVENTPYSTAFTMSKPGIVTAYLVPSLGGRSGNSVGKYYGYPDAPYTMAVGDELTPEIYPAIEENDYIGLNGSASADESIATFTYTDGVVKALAAGTVTLTAILTGSDMSFTVLNPKESSEQSNYNYPVTFSVVVGENLNTIFAANQNFGTWYNTSDKTYKVPDGITAYIITGVDGDKVTIAETKVIPPNAPILMEKGENAKAFTYTEATDTDGSFPSGNILNYTTTDKEAVEASKLYVLYNGQFVKVTAGTKILANHCYLDLGGTSAGTRGFYNIGDGEGTTAIREVIYEGVNSEKLADGAWHDLQGRKFTTKPTKPGLYILNGKKIVIK